MFLYKHMDGRVGIGPGSWFAIKDALGKDEAGNLVERSEDVPWRYEILRIDEPGLEAMTSVRQMPLMVEGEEMGTFHEVTPEASAASVKRTIIAVDEHVDSRLEEDRSELGEEPPATTIEDAVADDRKGNDAQVHQLIERNLRDSSEGPNTKATGITEERLNQAKTTLYPHRNEEAWARTGEKRQINALPEELGKASEDKKRERWNVANKSGPKRLLDKDVGEQLSLPKTMIKQKVAFNLKEKRVAALKPYGPYLEYRASKQGGWSDRFSAVREIDDELRKIMSKNANPSEEQRQKIDELKEKKAELVCPGAKIRSRGKGRGLGRGKGKGPFGGGRGKGSDACPGAKIRSRGKGRGKGYGKGEGPIGIPLGEKVRERRRLSRSAMVGEKKMDHSDYQRRLKSKSDEELKFIIKDAREAIEANPDNPNNGYYQDEISYAGMELRRRGKA